MPDTASTMTTTSDPSHPAIGVAAPGGARHSHLVRSKQ